MDCENQAFRWGVFIGVSRPHHHKHSCGLFGIDIHGIQPISIVVIDVRFCIPMGHCHLSGGKLRMDLMDVYRRFLAIS